MWAKLDPDRFATFEHGCAQGCGASGEGIEDPAAGGNDLDELPEQLSRLAGLMKLVALQHGKRQAARPRPAAAAALVDGTIGSPDQVFALMPEVRDVRRPGSQTFIPGDEAAPHPAGGLERIRRRGQLPPIDKEKTVTAGPHEPEAFGKPERAPERPRTLIAIVAEELDFPARN